MQKELFIRTSKLIFKLFSIVFAFSTLVSCSTEVTGVLNPKGIVAYEEKVLLFDATALMMIVVLPVIIMSFAFIYRYRASHKTAKYKPNWSHSLFLEALWWGIPCIIIVIMSVLSWRLTHKLDPYHQIPGSDVELKVQVVALPWKWLFIYPEQDIATVNYLQLPKDKQVEFYLTSDNVPMSAFFVPQLGSQIYTMAGMRTKLHLIANETGTFRGLNSQYNGDGFSEMHFPVDVVEPEAMESWFKEVKQVKQTLDAENYATLREPSIATPKAYYSSVNPNLFHTILMSYMETPEGVAQEISTMEKQH